MALTLVPGFMLDRDLWTDIAPALQRFGPLTHADPARATTIAEMARDTLDAAPARFALIGFSMGGYVAREMARVAPERVSRLVLIATSSRSDSELQERRRAVALGANAAVFRGVSRRSIAQSLAPEHEGDSTLISRIHDMSLRLGGETFRRQAMFRREGDLDQLASIRCPTLVVAGDRDRLRSVEESVEMAQAIPGARLEILPTGHMIPLEAPDLLARLLVDFLIEAA